MASVFTANTFGHYAPFARTCFVSSKNRGEIRIDIIKMIANAEADIRADRFRQPI
jgi:hypothetical protein